MVHLTKIGRHFFLPDGYLILGRNQEENDILNTFSYKGKILEALNTPSPTGLLINGNDEKLASSVLLGYTKLEEGEVVIKDMQNQRIIQTSKMPKMESSIYLSVPE